MLGTRSLKGTNTVYGHGRPTPTEGHGHRRSGHELSWKTVEAERLMGPSSECVLSAQTTSFLATVTLGCNDEHHVNSSLLHKDQPCDVKNRS